MDFKQFDEIFDDDLSFLMLLIGKSGSGKTQMIKTLMYYLYNHPDEKKRVHFTLGFCKSKSMNDDFSFIKDQKYIFEDYDENVFVKYFENLQKIKEEKGYVPRNVVILDDQVAIMGSSNDKFQSILSRYRHFNTHILISSQIVNSSHGSGLTPMLKTQCTYVCAFRDLSKQTNESLFNYFGDGFENWKQFRDFYKEMTEELYSFLLIRTKKRELDDIYMSLKFPVIPKNWPKL